MDRDQHGHSATKQPLSLQGAMPCVFCIIHTISSTCGLCLRSWYSHATHLDVNSTQLCRRLYVWARSAQSHYSHYFPDQRTSRYMTTCLSILCNDQAFMGWRRPPEHANAWCNMTFLVLDYIKVVELGLNLTILDQLLTSMVEQQAKHLIWLFFFIIDHMPTNIL